MTLRLMIVASRLHKTVRELLRDCTASEIGDWLEFFSLQNKPLEDEKNVVGEKVKKVMAMLGARPKDGTEENR